MHCYRAYSLTICSEFPLPELPPEPDALKGKNPDVTFRFGSLPRVVRLATANEELAFHNLAGGFHITNGNDIVVDPQPDASPEALRVILMGRMMAYLLRQRGWLSLHASGVIVSGRGVLFLGASGAGKSSMAAAFHSRGHQVMADDVAPVRICGDRCIGLPDRSRVRVDENSRPILANEPAAPSWDKYMVDLTRVQLPEKVDIGRIYLLADRDELASSPINPLNAVRFLSAHSFFRRQRMESSALQKHVQDCVAVATTAAIRELSRPRRLDALPDVVRFVERELEDA